MKDILFYRYEVTNLISFVLQVLLKKTFFK